MGATTTKIRHVEGRSGDVVTTVKLGQPSDDARRIVGAVTGRAIAEERHDRIILETPGVIEALEEALDEVAALKRARGL